MWSPLRSIILLTVHAPMRSVFASTVSYGHAILTLVSKSKRKFVLWHVPLNSCLYVIYRHGWNQFPMFSSSLPFKTKDNIYFKSSPSCVLGVFLWNSLKMCSPCEKDNKYYLGKKKKKTWWWSCNLSNCCVPWKFIPTPSSRPSPQWRGLVFMT